MAISRNSTDEQNIAKKQPELPTFIVDEDNVIREASRHAKDYYLWKIYAAKLESHLEAVENAMENTLGPMRDMLRDELISRRGRSGATEKAVADALRSDVKVRTLYQNYIRIKKNVAMAKAVLSALDRKTEMIKVVSYALSKSESAGL